jgi:hypothetical protein
MSRFAGILVGFVLAVTPMLAQFETSEVLGTVRDASQKAITNATVTLTNQDTGIAAKTNTDDGGNYDFFNVSHQSAISKSNQLQP